MNPASGKPVSERDAPPRRRGRRRDRASRWRRSSRTAARRRPTSTAARARCGATVDPRTGQPFFDHGGETNAGWVNAVRDVDGWGALVASNGNLIKASAEINEVLFPHILRGRNYLTDSGGAGQWRGGCGSHFVKEVRTPTSVNQYVVNQHHLHPGIAGGARRRARPLRASAAGTERAGRRRPVGRRSCGSRPATGSSTTSVVAAAGATRSTATRQAVLDDVWDEYVSIDGARATTASSITGSLED